MYINRSTNIAKLFNKYIYNVFICISINLIKNFIYIFKKLKIKT